MITIVDYHLGNVGSICNMLKRIGIPSVVSSDPGVIGRAKKLILPGVGAFDHGMGKLHQLGLVEVLNQRVILDQVPILGICLGAQLFTRGSEEGSMKGFGWIAADTIRFFSRKPVPGARVPHMAWSDIEVARPSLLFKPGETPRFYFVHSFHFVCDREEDILARCNYGYAFTAAMGRGNIYGVQFHPEKSHRYGFECLRRFGSAEATHEAL